MRKSTQLADERPKEKEKQEVIIYVNKTTKFSFIILLHLTPFPQEKSKSTIIKLSRKIDESGGKKEKDKSKDKEKYKDKIKVSLYNFVINQSDTFDSLFQPMKCPS